MKESEKIVLMSNNILRHKDRQLAYRNALARLKKRDKAFVKRAAKDLEAEIPRLSANGALELLAAIGIMLGEK